ncbi:MAG TPA: hypothetical protein VNB90_10955 [Cytophagaceae bacterium]|nr:hypothetical protein [Cytophagaceae bacterium]
MKRNKIEQDQEELIRLRSVEQVEPSPFLYARILHKIQERKKQGSFITPQFAWRLAAVFVVLVLVNVFVLFMNPDEITQETTMVADELGLVSDNYYDNY